MQNRYYMKDEVPFSDFPSYTENSTNKGKAVGIVIVVIFIIAGIVGGLYFVGKNKKSETPVVAPTEAPIPTEVPTETPSATPSGSITPTSKLTPTPSGTSSKIDRAKLSVAVLNGSGVVGAGKKVSDSLSALGYKIASTGNADTFDFKGITVKVTKANKDYGDLLKKDLADQTSGSVVVSVDDTITTGAAVIVGK